MKERFFVHRLHRPRDVAVPVEQWTVWLAGRPKQVFERRREQVGELRRAAGPIERDGLPVMPEMRPATCQSCESELLLRVAAKLLLDHRPKRRQVFLRRLPRAAWLHIFVIVAIEVSGCGHYLSRECRDVGPSPCATVAATPRK
jgi:hypothetical protein